MKRILASILSVIIVLSLSACQPTPKKATVVEKDSEQMLENAQKDGTDNSSGKSLSEQYDHSRKLSVRDAGHGRPAQRQSGRARGRTRKEAPCPIYRVRAAEFTQQQVDDFWEVLCGDAEMWIYHRTAYKG